MEIKKIFTQKEINHCGYARNEWVDTEETYEELVEQLKVLKGLFDGVRVVEKTFDTETFKITMKVLKKTELAVWTHEAIETIYEN